MKKWIPFFLLALAGFPLFAQNDDRIARTKTPLSQIEQVVMPHLDNEALLATEMERRSPGVAPRFAENIEVDISPATHGHWDYLPKGNAVWRVRILSEGAKSINLGFTRYLMPAGGTMILYSPDYQQVMGPFTPADNEEHEQLWTPVLPGDELVIEVQLPQHSQSLLQMKLKYVNHDFLGFAEIASGSCNLDVICGGADGWAIVDQYRDIIQSVAVIGTGGGTFCTGFLVNNARQDCTPFFMTAFHCGISAGNAPSLVAYWNFYNSTCRQPNSPASGGSGNGSLSDFNSGAVFRAGWSNSDFTLVEFDDPVSPSADAFFSGWSAEDFAPSDTVICIHHPSTDEKRISFEFDPTHIGAWGTGGNPVPNGNHVIIPDWDIGTTEGGSSGSPLFNNQKRVVGQLHGGSALCGNNEYDSYGWFHSSWEGGGTPGTRLRDWLDPDNSGVIVLDGRSQMACSFFVTGSPANVELCTPADAVYTISVSENFTDSVQLSLSDLPAGLTAVFGTNPVPPGGSTILTLSNTGALATGDYGFDVTGTDGIETNNSALTLHVTATSPEMPVLSSPENSESGIGLSPVFTWNALPFESYTFELAADANFTNILESATNLEDGSYHPGAPLMPLTTYYWRVKAANICGEGYWTATYTFTTGVILCNSTASADVPKPISSSGAPTISSTLQVSTPGLIDDVNVINLNVAHTWVGDLSIELTSPSGTTIILMTNPQGGSCQEDNIQIFFNDESDNPYGDLDAMCNSIPPAIIGDFQPFESLSAFIGEPATGTWTLTVRDNANQDGGSLAGWGLEVCTAIPDDFSLYPSGNQFVSCVNGEISFNVLLGTAFDATNGVTLSAENLPPGATASFDPNPAPPGANVTVTVSGASMPGDFLFGVIADDETNTSNTEIEWFVVGAPAPPTAVSPAQNATNVNLNPVFSWSSVPNPVYTLRIATDPGMNDIIFTSTVNSSSLIVQGLLDYCTVYYWTVSADNSCGDSGPSEVFSFETVAELTFNASPGSITSCNSATVSTTLSLGECFGANGVTLSASGLPANAAVQFSANPAPANSEVEVEVMMTNVTPGTYTITINGTDGTNQVSDNFNLVVNGPAQAPVMILPANTATDVSLLPTFDWDPVPGSNSYKFELASDDNFSNIITETTFSQTIFSLTSPLEKETTYYWRVTAFNNCGGTTPAPFSFTTKPVNAVREFEGLAVDISPNPASELLNIRFSAPVREEIQAGLYSANGVLLKQQILSLGHVFLVFDCAEYPPGIYFLKLQAKDEVLTERIIIQK